MHQRGGTERKCKAKITSGTNGIGDRSWVKENMPSRTVSDIGPWAYTYMHRWSHPDVYNVAEYWNMTVHQTLRRQDEAFPMILCRHRCKMHETHVLGSWLAIYERSCKKSRKIRIRLVAGTASIVRHTSHGLLLRSSHCSGILHWSRMSWKNETFHSITSTVRQFLNHKYENQGVLQKRI